MIRILIPLLMLVSLSLAGQVNHQLPGRRTIADSNLIMPPAWAFGILYGGYTDQKGTIERVNLIREHHYPIDAYWIDSWFWSYADKGRGPQKYIDFIADTVSYPDRAKMWSYLKQFNIKGGFWTWDCILETGNEKAFQDFKSKGFFSNIYSETNPWHNNSLTTDMFRDDKDRKKGTLCGNIDFDNPSAAGYFKKKMKHFFEEGADFIKLDRTTVSTCKTMFELSQESGRETKGRGFLFSHSFETENDAYKRYPAKWTDDTRSDWTVEDPLVQFPDWTPRVALKENIAMFTDPAKSTSSIPFLANDLGGFTPGNKHQPDEELFIRWLQFSVFNPVVEVFSGPENTTSNLAWMYSKRADSIFHYYAHLRLQLFPYIYSNALRCRTEGRHMIGKFPDHTDQFTFGDQLLIAPVYEKGAVTRKVFLPEGKWFNFWTGELLQGNMYYTTSAPVSQIPVFIKQGAVLPVREAAISVEKGNNHTLTLHVFPGDHGQFDLLEDDGTSNDYLKNIYASTIIELKKTGNGSVVSIGSITGSYKGMSPVRKWKIVLHQQQKPQKVLVNGHPVVFRFDALARTTLIETTRLPVVKPTSIEIIDTDK